MKHSDAVFQALSPDGKVIKTFPKGTTEAQVEAEMKKHFNLDHNPIKSEVTDPEEITKLFPAGTPLTEVEDYLSGKKTPSFRFANNLQMAQRFIKQIAWRKFDFFSPFEISEDVVEEHPLETRRPVDECSPYILAWAKPSIFWLKLDYEGKHYTMVCVICKNYDLYQKYMRKESLKGGWVTRSSIYQYYMDEDKIDLLDQAALPDATRAILIDWGLTLISKVIDGLLKRDVKYVQTAGKHTLLDSLRGHKAVVTVSLSRPRYVYPHDHTHVPSGIKMPEHEVRGHWRRVRRLKVGEPCIDLGSDDPRIDSLLRVPNWDRHLMAWIPEHVRGDPSVPRRTITRVVP